MQVSWCAFLLSLFASCRRKNPGHPRRRDAHSYSSGNDADGGRTSLREKHVPTAWISKVRIWNFPEYSLILFFEGPGNVSSRLTICRKKSLMLAEAAQYVSRYLPKGCSVVGSKLSNDSQPVVFKSSNPLNYNLRGGWMSYPDWYYLDFHNARLREEINAKVLLGAIHKGVRARP